MAFKPKAENPIEFFQKVFGVEVLAGGKTVVEVVTKLILKEYVFDISLYTVKVSDKLGGVTSASLTVGSSTLMKNAAPPSVQQLNKLAIVKMLIPIVKVVFPELYADQEKPPALEPDGTKYTLRLLGAGPSFLNTIKVLRTVLGWDLKAAKIIVDSVPCTVCTGLSADVVVKLGSELSKVGAPMVWMPDAEALATPLIVTELNVTTTIKKNQPTSEKVYLKDALALAQPVFGSSTGSTYYVIAYNSRVKVASRIKPDGNISIRVELQGATTAEKKLVGNAVTWQGEYGSIHLSAGNIPPARVIGAFLMGMGVKFDQQVTNAEELKISAK